MQDILKLSNHKLEEVFVLEEEKVGQKAQLIVYNDDFNTFDWVIQSLIEICSHSFEQSEQLSVLIHFKGKAVVKSGALNTLKPMKDALIDRGLSAIIETEVEKN